MPEGKNHDIERSHSKRWSKTSICEIGNYFWDNLIYLIFFLTFLVSQPSLYIQKKFLCVPQSLQKEFLLNLYKVLQLLKKLTAMSRRRHFSLGHERIKWWKIPSLCRMERLHIEFKNFSKHSAKSMAGE